MDRNEEPSLYEGLFLAKDEEVSAFLNNVRGSSTTRVCLIFHIKTVYLLLMFVFCVYLLRRVISDFTGK